MYKNSIIKRNTGITLVALVITIIVLIILAGVTISLTLGENGLLGRAEESKNAHLAGEKNDVEFMNSAYEYMNKYFGESGIKELDKDEITNPNLKDNENIKAVITGEVPIPIGAEYKEGTKETGVVITFGDSEFVWGPVPQISEMAKLQSGSDVNYEGVLYDFEGTTATEMTDYGVGTVGYREPDTVHHYGGDYDGNTEYLTVINNILGTSYETEDHLKVALQTDYNEMVASITKYKGFFVGRYETSLDENKKAKSKVGVLPATAEKDSGNMWYGLYAYQKKMAEDNNYASVKSHMIWGSNYDAMLRWALTGTDAAKVTDYHNSDHDIGRLYETGKVTVEGKIDRINNIYDLEGNGYEWTAETSRNYFRSTRGGYYYELSKPCQRDDEYAYRDYRELCSRSILYIK